MSRKFSALDFIQRYGYFLFSAKPIRVVHIGAVTSAGRNQDGAATASTLSRRKHIVTLVVTCTMTFLVVGSFLCVLVFAFFIPDREVPIIIRDILIATLGYFGGTLVDFIKAADV